MKKQWQTLCSGLMIVGAAVGATSALAGVEAPGAIPEELSPFVPAQSHVVTYKAADLNGDGLSDYVLISESDAEANKGERSLRLITRQSDKSLKLVKENNKVVLCATCGGVMGDPLDAVTAKSRLLMVRHQGGSNTRWVNNVSFGYSHVDNTWQVTRIDEGTWSSVEPNKITRVRFTPPKDFGKIDIADFDPENYKGVGEK